MEQHREISPQVQKTEVDNATDVVGIFLLLPDQSLCVSKVSAFSLS
jgi:hypothetical protein